MANKLTDIPEGKFTRVPEGESGLKKSDEPKPDHSTIEPVPIDNQWLTLSWYVVLVKINPHPPNQKHEDVRALEAMHALSIPAWYATTIRRRRCDGKGGDQHPVCRLAFPGYLFVGKVPDFRQILDVRHIRGILGYQTDQGHFPLRLSTAEIGALFAGEDVRNRNAEIKRMKTWKEKPPQIGESISVEDGFFGKFDTKIEGLIRANEVQALRKILGGERLVDIPLDKISRK